MRIAGLLALLALAACNTTPIDASLITQPDELRRGGGLLTGPTGEFSRSF